MSPFLLRFLAIALIGLGTISTYQIDPPVQQQIPENFPIQLSDELTTNPLTSSDEEKLEAISNISAFEWLGPLAPIAISPFFAITILAGLSQFGGDFVQNSFISDNPVLSNPAVFWIFLCLTIVTSLPRFTKVSKPAAQAIDQLEAYAGIITIVLIRLLTTMGDSDPVGADTAMVVQMGVFSFSADVLLSIAAIINIFVINTVKFFFEVMVWLIPIPMVDAALEVTNKSLCAGLMMIYAWSPLVATILNLIIFIGCLFAFRWIYRRVQYMRSVLCDPIWSLIQPSYGDPKTNELVVFPQKGVVGFPAKTKLLLQSTESGWRLVKPNWFRPAKVVELPREAYQLEMQTGLLLNSVQLTGNGAYPATDADPESDKLLFSKRYSKNLDKLCDLINVNQSEIEFDVDLRSEFA